LDAFSLREPASTSLENAEKRLLIACFSVSSGNTGLSGLIFAV
jgi:hypothetical protein